MELTIVKHVEELSFRQGDAILVVDVQNDFLPGGALAVQEGDVIIPGINELLKTGREHDLPIVFTQDWHPEGHYSFASMHEGKQPFDHYEAEGLGPVLWPDHCVQGTEGSKFPSTLNSEYAQAIIRKGFKQKIDSYSGFLENDHKTETGLDGYLKGLGVKRIFLAGLAYDYCVYFTAADGADKGYEVVMLTDLTQPVGSPEGSIERATKDLIEKGVQFTKSSALKP